MGENLNSNVIHVEHLRKTYGSVVAVNDISFEVRPGEVFGLLGPNGAGKTTCVECLQGLRHPTAGNIRVLGLDPVSQAHALRPRIGSQLQKSELPYRIKVWEALELFSFFTPGARDWKQLMKEWDLVDRANALFSNLSGGERQRLFIALALVSNPEVVFLDEMTTGLDPVARHVAWSLIKDVRARGTTVVLVTHFMDEAEELCDRLAIIDKGNIVALDSPQKLISKNASYIKVRFTTNSDDLSWLNKIEYVKKLTRQGPQVEIEGTGPVLPVVAAALVNHGIIPEDLRIKQPSLEDVFLNLTGHKIED